MGLTKQYLRYVPGPIFNVIASVHANAVFVQLRAQAGRYVAVAGCENALIWDTRTGEKVLTLAGEKDSATVLRAGPSGNHLAVGYDDGAIRLFDLMSGECLVTYSGHKSAVTCLQFDREGTRLVSGSKDTNLIVWDTVTEAGLFRLTGHKGPITQCRFFESRNLLVSSSKDALVKFWDLDAQHCFLTLPDHRSEVWDLVLLGADRFLVTGCSDSELRVWKIDFTDEQSSEEDQGPASEAKRPRTDATEGAANETESGDDSSLLRCTQFGTILRQGRDRLVSLALDAYGGLLACHGTDAIVELFRFHDADEVKKRLAKRQRKAKKKLLAAENGAPTTEPANQSDLALSLQDVMSRLPSIRASGKIKGLDLYRGRVDELKLAILLGNNGIEIHQVEAKEAPAAKKTLDGAAASLLTRVSAPGHRSDVRALAFSADNIAVASASGESLKIWNRSSQRCVRTMSCGYGLALVFAPGDRHVVVATKTGKLQVFDVASGRLLEETQAHEGEAWSVCLSPDLRGLASGGADKTLKFWQFELVADVVDEDSITGSSAKRLALHHTKTLQLEEDVLCVRYSPDQRLIAVAQLDSTVKIFFCDTLKFFLSLYGHKFPVLCMDISHDSSIIITAGADRNIKIWGLDFGDCHRSIFAHEDSIMGLQFVSKTHLFFSCSKDGLLKQWDADNFESVVTLTGHHGQIWTLAVSHDGKFVTTAGHDRSIRLWHRTQEPLVLDDERETEREKLADQALATGEDRTIAGQKADGEASLPGRKTAETERAAERIMEAIEVHEEQTKQLEEHRAQAAPNAAPPPAHPLMVAHNTDDPDRYLLCVLRQVRSSELEEALLVLPFHYVTRLLELLERLLARGWDTELLTRMSLFLVRLHHGPVSHATSLLPVIQRLRRDTRRGVETAADRVGLNLAALDVLQRRLDERHAVQLFSDASEKVKNKRGKRQRKDQATRRALLTL